MCRTLHKASNCQPIVKLLYSHHLLSEARSRLHDQAGSPLTRSLAWHTRVPATRAGTAAHDEATRQQHL